MSGFDPYAAFDGGDAGLPAPAPPARADGRLAAEQAAAEAADGRRFPGAGDDSPPRPPARSPGVPAVVAAPAAAVPPTHLTNGWARKVPGEGVETNPHHIAKIAADLDALTGGWPRRTGGQLFAPEAGADRVRWIGTVPGLLAYVGERSARPPEFCPLPGFHTAGELKAHLEATATDYRGVETLPHEPPIPGFYYACGRPGRGDGRRLAELLDRFSPATETDRDLILAMFLTPLWGGDGGCRPAFLVTADTGRGAGKSRLVRMLGNLYGGQVELAQGEDFGRLKGRLLSAEAVTMRVAVLDNVKSPRFSWGELEGLMTAATVSGWRLYHGEASRPNVLTYCITLNGAALSTDVAQRCVIVKVTRPTFSGSWEEETVKFIERHRAAIFADLAEVLRSDRRPPPTFSRWGSWEKDVLSRLADPAAAQRVILERQGEANVEEEEAEIITDLFADRLRSAGYSPETDRVFVPNEITAEWFNAATGERHTVPRVTRALKQIAEESKGTYPLSVCPSHKNGRGFVWAGAEASPGDPLNGDLAPRLDRQRGGFR